MYIIPAKKIQGEIIVPGDKSISHRAVIIGSIANGITEINKFSTSEDCKSTVTCFKKLGINIELKNSITKVYGKGLYGLTAPKSILDVGNSGTTARLIMGILAGQSFNSSLDGDFSIRKRPMDRVTNPLSKMGASFSEYKFLPSTINGAILKGITYNSPISSAQVKSSILLASLYAEGKTIYSEPFKSRDHTEHMLKSFGAKLEIEDNTIRSSPTNNLNSQKIIIPNDLSSAAYFITLSLIIPNSCITIKNTGINPTRTGIIDVLKKMGASIKIENIQNINNEPLGDITVYSSQLKGTIIEGQIIPRLIDELPIIAVAATQANGATIIKNAQELKVKESNRISAIVNELKKMGASIEETDDGMAIEGPIKLKGCIVDSHSDHRIAMSLAVAGACAYGESFIENSECVNISYPDFFNTLKKVCL